ncbi:MAG: hypothetical protein AB1749_14810 [Pseudomonadota bacterium]
MRTYLITYDLAHPHRNKHVLAQEIMTLGARWARPLEQTWYVSSHDSEAAMESRLAGLLDADDGLLIQAVDEDAVLTNTSLRWFRQRRTPLDIAAGSNVVAFPTPVAAPADEPELPLACAS